MNGVKGETQRSEKRRLSLKYAFVWTEKAVANQGNFRQTSKEFFGFKEPWGTQKYPIYDLFG